MTNELHVDTLLSESIDNTDFYSFQNAINLGADVNFVDHDGLTPVMRVIMSMSVIIHGESEEIKFRYMVDALLETTNLDLNVRDSNGNTALHLASMLQNNYVVNKLLERNDLDVLTKNYKKQTAMRCARQTGARHISKILEDRMISQLVWTRILIRSIIKGDLFAVKYSYNHGANINSKLSVSAVENNTDLLRCNSETPLHVAASSGRLVICKYLLNINADVNAKNRKNNTALVNAIIKNRIAVAKLLIARGSDVFCRCERGKTPLHFAVEMRRMKLVTYLMKNTKYNFTVLDNFGRTPFGTTSDS